MREALGADAEVQVANRLGVSGAYGAEPAAAAVAGRVLGVRVGVSVLITGLEEDEGVGAIKDEGGLLGDLLVHVQKAEVKTGLFIPDVGYVVGGGGDGEDLGVDHVADFGGQLLEAPEPRGAVSTLSVWLNAGDKERCAVVAGFAPF